MTVTMKGQVDTEKSPDKPTADYQQTKVATMVATNVVVAGTVSPMTQNKGAMKKGTEATIGRDTNVVNLVAPDPETKVGVAASWETTTNVMEKEAAGTLELHKMP